MWFAEIRVSDALKGPGRCAVFLRDSARGVGYG